jgi:hypothetical protein
MNNAIEKCNSIGDGGYTCNILSLQENPKIVAMTKTRVKYSSLFEFDDTTVLSKIEKPASIKQIKDIRLNCLELFKAITLESKGYEKL